ncbi:MAG: hypothetical protein K8T26_05800 [Lentisphaerae bacterium]|nr:hypothetical protein [Lentisphaerota bacterium]
MKRDAGQTTSGPSSRRGVLLLRALLVIGAVALSLVIGEALARRLRRAPDIRPIDVSVPDSYFVWSDNPLLGYTPRPGASGVNSAGWRGIECPVAKPEGVRRIIMLGDSVLEMDDYAISDLISSRLQALFTDGKTEVLNLAVGGYCTLAEVERLRVVGLQYEPDMVVMVFVMNDFDNYNSEVAMAWPRRPRGVNWGFRHLHLFRLACLRWDWFGFVRQADPALRNNDATGSNNVSEGFRRLKELAVARGFEARVAIWPDFVSQDVVDPCPLPGTEHLVVEVLAAAEGIPTFRLSHAFRTHASQLLQQGIPVSPATYTIGDGMHPNALGAAIAAQAIHAVLSGASPGGTAPALPEGEPGLALYRRAMEAATRYAVRQPNLSEALVQAARLREDDDPAACRRLLASALLADSTDPIANTAMGFILMLEDNPEEARRCFERALSRDPYYTPARNGLEAARRARRLAP